MSIRYGSHFISTICYHNYLSILLSIFSKTTVDQMIIGIIDVVIHIVTNSDQLTGIIQQGWDLTEKKLL